MDSIFQKTYFKKVLKNFLASGYHIARKNKSMIELCSYLKIGKKSNCETFFFSKWDMKKIEKFARDTYGNEFVDSIKPKKFFDDFCILPIENYIKNQKGHFCPCVFVLILPIITASGVYLQ